MQEGTSVDNDDEGQSIMYVMPLGYIQKKENRGSPVFGRFVVPRFTSRFASSCSSVCKSESH